MVAWLHSVSNGVQTIALARTLAAPATSRDRPELLSDPVSAAIVGMNRWVNSRNPWLLDVMKACLQREPAKRPAIEGPNGLLEHPFLQPQGQRALQLYKQMSIDNAIMREGIRQIHEVARDRRWEKEGIVQLVTKVGVEKGMKGRNW